MVPLATVETAVAVISGHRWICKILRSTAAVVKLFQHMRQLQNAFLWKYKITFILYLWIMNQLAIVRTIKYSTLFLGRSKQIFFNHFQFRSFFDDLKPVLKISKSCYVITTLKAFQLNKGCYYTITKCTHSRTIYSRPT